VSGIQWSVIAFFAAVWVALAIILVVAPEIYGLTAAGVSPGLFFAAISVVLAVCVIGIVRRWSWLFWLIEIAFLAGALRIVASGLELAGVIPFDAPRWYVTLQGAIGLAQLVIGIAMLRSYRRAEIWGRATER
jgi:hypothetical protein